MSKNKKIILILITLISVFLIARSFSKYVIEKEDIHAQNATAFYFENELTEETEIRNWNGATEKTVEFNIRNYTDTLQRTNEEITYKIEASIIDNSDDGINDADLIDIEIQDKDNNTVTDDKELLLSNTDFNEDNYKLKITPKTSIENGKKFNIEIKAIALEPYTKELVTNLTVEVNAQKDYEIQLIDSENGEYITLNLKINNVAKDISIKYDNTKLILDKSNYIVSSVNEIQGNKQSSFYIAKENQQAGNIYEINFIKKNITDEIELGTDIIIDELENDIILEDGNITFSEIKWDNNRATVEVTNNSEYYMQYQIVPKGGEIDTDGIWTTSAYKTVTITDLQYAERIVVRLYDGKNVTTNYATLLITETINPQITLKEVNTTTKSIEVIANATDNESGIELPYKFYISKSIGEFETTPTGTSTDGKYIFEDLDTYTTYYIKVEIEDLASNKKDATITVQTKLVPPAEQNITREIKWNVTGTAQVLLSPATQEASNFTILYSTDEKNSWNEYKSPVTVNNGDTIYMCLSDGRNKGEEYALKVEDNKGPVVTLTKAAVTSNSITIQVKAEDADSGMPVEPKYTYYIKKDTEEIWEEKSIDITSSNYIFSGLTAQTTYNIKVVTKDLIGNIGEGTIDVTTNEFVYGDGNITFSEPEWSDKKASVKIKNNTIYDMEYQIIPKGETIDINATWQKTDEKEITIGNLLDEYQIIARLTDGINVTEYATCIVDDNTNPTVSVEINPNEWTNQEVTLTINAEDTESGLQAECYSFDGGITWQSENTKTYQTNTVGIIIKVRDEAGNIATYNTQIENIDKTGPTYNANIRTTSNTITIELTDIIDAGVGMEDQPTYKYYITTNSQDIETILPEESNSTTMQFPGLTQDTLYYLKIEVQDKLGNKNIIYRTVSTGSIDTDENDLTISNPIWANKKASVTITNNSTYNMEYQVVKSGESVLTDGWIITEEKTINLNDLLHGNIVNARLTDGNNVGGTVTKEVRDITAPTITVDKNPTEWTNENVTITINAEDTESGLQDECYSFDGGITWQTENTKQYTANTDGIVIQVRDEAGNIATNETININNIDKNPPNIVLETTSTTTKEITVHVTAVDTEVGMPEKPMYKYSIRKEGETENLLEKETEDDTFTFEKLDADTKYYIKVETIDKLSNLGEEEISATTQKLNYASGDITLTQTIWSNGIATITVNNSNEDFDLEYQIVEDGENVNENGTWNTVKEKTIDIGNLISGQTVYARLTDGFNHNEGYTTFEIINPAKETYTEAELASTTTREDYKILGISVSDNEIRVQINEEQTGAQLYNYYYKTINDDKYTLISTCTYHDDPAVITNVTEGATYKIKVLVLNEDGTVTRSENTATTIALEQAETNTVYTGNRTYIDNSTTLQVRTTAGTGSAGDGTTEETLAGYTISLPETFKISNTSGENKQTEGVVLKDSSDNEFIWIPVNDAIYDGVTEIPTSSAESKTYKPMAQLQTGYSNYYESIVYNFNGTTSYKNSNNTGLGKTSYREPSLITNNANDGYSWNIEELYGINYDADNANYNTILGFDSTKELGEYLVSNYSKMIDSVDSYGGFYVGRYETTQTTKGTDIVVGSKANSTPLTDYNWYYMNLYQDSQKYTANPYYQTISVVSNMIYGSQWDSMLNYILTGNDNGKVTTQNGSQKNEISNTAQDPEDIINNFYDLGSNANELTQEASGINARIYRGGGYDTTKGLASPATRTTVVPTDKGDLIGSRLALYIRSTNDVTGPAVAIKETNSTTNKITIQVEATDKETGVKKYTYYISEDETNFGTGIDSISPMYIFTQLKQNTTYYIKVEATDGAGNVGEEEITTFKTQELGNVAQTAITKTQEIGLNGQGIVELQLDSNYENEGYYIEYQVINENETFDINGTWIKGNRIENLSNGQKIYATLYDGINRSADYFEAVINGLEAYEYYIDKDGNSSETATVLYTDENGETAYIPAGFKVGTGNNVKNINNGLVIEDVNGNQYVWVPVETAIETETSTTSTEKAMARYQSGSNKYYEGILYNFNGTTSTKQRSTTALGTSASREPSLVTGNSDYTWNLTKETAKGSTYDTVEKYYNGMGSLGVNIFNSYTEMGQYMNNEYTNMINSVKTFGGFYVGRYETSVSSGTAGRNDVVVQVKKDIEPIKNQYWYRDYYYQDSNINPLNPYYSSKSVTSSMIWGSQWDAILNWMLKDDNTKDFPTKVAGNRTGIISKTGQYTDDLAKNIFDMSANVLELTQEANGSTYRLYRGGSYLLTTDKYGKYTAGSRYTTWQPPDTTSIYTNTGTGSDTTVGNQMGTRMALYLNNITDETVPTLSLSTPVVGTNNISVEAIAEDAESGINKYKYSISYKDFNAEDFTETDIISTTEAYGNTYTFENLYQNTTYYIKVEVINNSGLSTIAYIPSIKTNALTVEEEPIALEKTYGKDGEGIAYFTLSEQYENEKYHIEYQIGKSGAGVDIDGTWTTGDIVKGLSIGDIVYTRINDGKNVTGQYKASTIVELETFSETYETTEIYRDYDITTNEDGEEITTLVGEAYIPAGFKVGTSSLNKKIENGLVIEDEAGNQYVWIPMDKDKVIYDGVTEFAKSNNSSTYKPLARYQSGYNAGTEQQYFEGVFYSYSGVRSYVISNNISYRIGTSGYREPSLVTGSDKNYSWVYSAMAGAGFDATNYTQLSEINGITDPTSMGQYINDKFTEMVLSVQKYGGFYVGRYETSRWETDNWSTGGNNKENTGNIIKSVPNATPMATTNWYKMYLNSDSNYSSNPYYTSASVNSAMIWGSQWDAMLNYILEGSDKDKVTKIIGNHTDKRATTGQFPEDILNNIFDLGSNVREWTQEAYSYDRRVGRGGLYYATVAYTASDRYHGTPTSPNYVIGSRLTLYLK